MLIRKKKPKWQAGLLNGIGCKVEKGEAPLDAMVREFKEETGVDSTQCGWREFGRMSWDGFVVHCFTAKNLHAFLDAKTVEDEPIEKLQIHELHHLACVSNLHWLVAMASDENDGKPFFANVTYNSSI